MQDSACRWLIVEGPKIFRSYVKHFLIFPHERKCKILNGLCKYVFGNYPFTFLDRDNKTKLISASISFISKLLQEKIKF